VRPVRAAVLDLNDGVPNRGLDAIRRQLNAADKRFADRPITVDVFDVRQEAAVPDLGYDVYVSSGGPGSPFDGEATAWEAAYFDWIAALWDHNQAAAPAARKHALFICHSFQLLCRHFRLGAVTKRGAQSFGIVPVRMTAAGRTDPLFDGLDDPFHAADFRWWQVVRPDRDRFAELGATILARETHRDGDARRDSDAISDNDTMRDGNAPERAVMGVRLSPEIVGVQFHPEADPDGMLAHFRTPERRATVVERFGEAKYERLIRRLDEMDALRATHAAVVPAFLRRAITPSAPSASSR
jgi:GMP synthase-like glutamine amidotransferase